MTTIAALIEAAAAGRATSTEQQQLARILTQARAELAGRGRALRRATVELAAAQPLIAACPYCRALPNTPCVPIHTSAPPVTPHTARYIAANREAHTDDTPSDAR